MCTLTKCCCCKLVTGVYIVAGWTLAACGILLAAIIYVMHLYDHACLSGVYEMVQEFLYGRQMTQAELLARCHLNHKYVALCAKLVLTAVWSLSAGGLVVGARKKNLHLYIPWIVVTSIVLLFNSIVMLYLVIGGYYTEMFYIPQLTAIAIIYPAVILTWIYCLMVVGSHIDMLRKENRLASDVAPLAPNMMVQPMRDIEYHDKDPPPTYRV
jgi:hypothetical protein